MADQTTQRILQISSERFPAASCCSWPMLYHN